MKTIYCALMTESTGTVQLGQEVRFSLDKFRLSIFLMNEVLLS